MTEAQKQQLEKQLWNIADSLRGKMNADEFKFYILGFIFYKYLSEKIYIYANKLLINETIKDYSKIDEKTIEGKAILEEIKINAIDSLGYFLKPTELFKNIAIKGNSRTGNDSSNFILEDLQKILKNIQSSTMGTESEDDFDNLFSDLDLDSQKLGRTVKERNELNLENL